MNQPAPVAPQKILCANGLAGYDLEKGTAYVPRDPCKNYAPTGHIFCPACRVAAGGKP